MTQLGVNVESLVMPTRGNLEIMERAFAAAAGLVDMKRQVERVEQELRTLRAQRRDGYVPPIDRSARKVCAFYGVRR